MPALHIRDVPEETIAALKAKAARHGRSMQQELREVLDAAAAAPARKRPDLRPFIVNSGNSESWDRADIYD